MDVLPHLDQLARIIDLGGAHFETRTLGEVTCQGQRLPIQSVALGNPDPCAPAVGFFGGFHGLELIGAEVVLAFLQNLASRLKWDTTLHRQLETVRLVFMPLVNPGGMLRGTRANPSGVDLMRNAPVDALERVPRWIGGQRLSSQLPWYRGREGAAMEAENLAVCAVIAREFQPRAFSLTVDCHSGFGLHDRIWFPFAHTRTPIAHLAELHALWELLGETLCNYPYVFEPQSSQYLAHGDLWDHLYLDSLPGLRPGPGDAARAPRAGGPPVVISGARQEPDRVFLPMTLEMGSWTWVKKNPRQLFSLLGMFNPLIEHRQQRVLRRHLPLLEFFVRAAISHDLWLPRGPARAAQRARGLSHWYPERPTEVSP